MHIQVYNIKDFPKISEDFWHEPKCKYFDQLKKNVKMTLVLCQFY